MPKLLHRARPDDGESLCELIREFYAVDGHPWDESKVRRSLPALLESDAVGLVWLIDRPAVGYLVITWGYSIEAGGREALLDEIYVRERGRGLGRGFSASLGFEEEDSIWMQRPLHPG